MLGGRKPIPAALIDPQEHKKSYDEIQQRIEVESSLKTSSKLTCPKYLSDVAKKEWKRVIKLYRSLDTDILCDLDISSLVIYCEAWAEYRQAQDERNKITQDGDKSVESQKVIDRCVNRMASQTKIINSISEQLCLTPVGRARMGMMSKKTNHPSPLVQLIEDDD